VTKRVSAQAVKWALSGGGEIALLDVREHGQYGEGHPFFSVSVPFSRLEVEAPRLVPRLATSVIVFDDADGVAERASAQLKSLGFSDVAVLEGGAPAWASAGYVLFKGVNLPSKAFGELVEHALGTPHISAQTLNEWSGENVDMVILDGRSPAEYTKMSIPGARSCPNAELGLRIPDLVASAQTTIVVNCAGRTRSIIGAENLRVLGLPNPIVALENGTQGWQLAGFELERGEAAAAFSPVSEAHAQLALSRAGELITRYEIPRVALDTLATWRKQERSLYVLDVRTAEEFAAGRLPSSVHAPGGQLAQSTDQWVGVRGARIVLVDDYEVRAALTARWLRGMGHDAYIAQVTRADLCDTATQTPSIAVPTVSELGAPEVARQIETGARVLDVSSSNAYRDVHLAVSDWAIRPRLAEHGLSASDTVLLIAEDLEVAALVAKDLRAAQVTVAGVMLRDVAEWESAGLAVERCDSALSNAQCIDFLFFVHDRHEGNMEAARAYLAWETGLIGQLGADERAVLDPR
jgi:rhodanese-related sulfurtransferase